ncbi:MAG: hypothetical protein IT249_13385 [Chitinophagaceae bacterium]|nr:hypothetical protein [Chitinophagaceae bacterium]
MKKIAISACFLFTLVFFISGSIHAQDKKKAKGELYISWGYNTEWYTRSNVHINQPSLNNDYTFNNIKGHDRKGWNSHLFQKELSIPQYNYRLGYFFNPEKGWGVEINFDHTKFIFGDEQDVSLTGKLNGRQVDTTIRFSERNGFFYYLNNGANFLLFNVVKRYRVFKTHNENFKLDFLGKAGIGPVIPHVENSFFSNKNKPHFQLGGWNVGLEATLKATFFKYGFIEYANKLDYARYSHLKIYEGTAKHAFGTYEMILNIGANVPIGRYKE